MLTKIKKRDGREVPFNIEKIADAVFKSFAAAKEGAALEKGYSSALEVAEKVGARLEAESNLSPGVEEIQDVVEDVLIASGYARAAKAYILYRAQRSRAREMKSRLMGIYAELTFKEAQDNDLKRENANIDGDTAMGTMLRYGSEGAKQFNEIFVLHPEHAAAHKEGDIHIHDMDFLTLTTTCCQIDLDALFKNGFGTGHGTLREPNHIQSYAALACIAIQANQNDQHGGQSIANFDYALAPGVRKTYAQLHARNLEKAHKLLSDPRLFPDLQDRPDLQDQARAFAREETEREIQRATYQAMEALVHNLNTMHSRAGAQIPFSSLNYGTDTSPEGRMVTKNLLLATEAGLGNGETPIFPVSIFKVKEGINYNPGDPNYDLFQLACRVSAKRLFPNFAFIDAPFNLKYYRPGRPETEVAYMGCRTRVMGNVADPSREIVSGRGNLSFTTVNLPRLALRVNRPGNIPEFFGLLDEKIGLVVGQLLDRFEIQAKKKVKNFPFLMGQGVWMDSGALGREDEIREVLKHGTLSMGFIGLAECLKALTGEHHGQSGAAQKLGLEIVRHMRRRMDEASAKHKLNFTLLATPAEGTAGRFVKMDRALFGAQEGITDRNYYTNSFHVPVHYKLGAYDKIRLEAPYHELTNAGHITYVEMDGDPLDNLEAFEKLVRAMKEAGVGYGSINHPLDRDPVCGYTGVIGEVCPHCGRREDKVKFERIRRITGYLVGTLDRFNDAKKAEERDRVHHA
ncbi:MAG: anaerobic ribonucleoside triphosphate reductase [Synergistaceae bacterium]|jgi:ribonucleoside-triphosphate reductase|nr:anaerobic ribonucleoside triphosphate reductase [Synergistaceae bacterium]